ncbi:MAG: N-acetylglucosamine-6-phosphate deacetylase, partial [Alphaproteobacteria bacterium]
DSMAGEDGVRAAARLHARHGTTSLLAAAVTAPPADLHAAAAGVGRVAAARRPGEARVLGLHLEGPFLNPARLGAQPPFPQAPDAALVDRIAAAAPLRLVTLAPELDAGFALTRRLAAAGIVVQIGHTEADYDTCLGALAAGARSFTHLFNAMTRLDHRAPGAVGAALAAAEYAAVIPDLVHVHAGALRAALRAVPRLYATTDATAAAGMPDGEYPLGRHTVAKRGDAVFLPDGTLAGSALTMDRALAVLVGLGLDLADAVRRVSTFPADLLGLAERGRIAPGAFADLVVLEPALTVCAVYVEGTPLAS